MDSPDGRYQQHHSTTVVPKLHSTYSIDTIEVAVPFGAAVL